LPPVCSIWPIGFGPARTGLETRRNDADDDAAGKNWIMIYGPKKDGTYVVEGLSRKGSNPEVFQDFVIVSGGG